MSEEKVNLYPYIHYRFQNYMLYGLNSDEKSSFDLSKLRRNYDFPNNNAIPQSMINKIKAGIISLFEGEGEEGEYRRKREEIQQRIVDENMKNIVKTFNEMGDIIATNKAWHALNEQLKQKGSAQMSKSNISKLIAFVQNNASENNIIRHLNLLRMTRDKLDKEIKNITKKGGQLKDTDLISWVKKSEDLINTYENIESQLGGALIIDKSNASSRINTAKFDKIENATQLRTQINKAHQQTMYLFRSLLSISSIQKMKGEYLEQIGAEVFLNVSNFGDKSAATFADGSFKAFGESLKGVKGQVGGLKTGSVDQYKNLKKNFKEEASNNYSSTLFNVDYSEELSKDIQHESKADISIIYELNGKEIPLGISAKNVNLYGNYYGVGIVSGTPLLYLLQNDFDLTWHTGNIFAVHESDNNHSMENTLKRMIMPYLKELILYSALTGNTTRGKSDGFKATADYFLINNNKKAGIDSIDLISIGELYRKVINSRGAMIEVGGKNIESMRFKNDWVDPKERSGLSAIIRQRNVLLDMHQQKVNVKIKTNVFKNLT